MKKTYTALLTLAALISTGSAAVITMSTTSVGSRVLTTAAASAPVADFVAPQLVTTGGYVLGYMTNESDFSTFVAFGTANLGTTGGFPTGGVINNSVTNNSYADTFAGLTAYMLVYSGNAPTIDGVTHKVTSITNPFAGIYKSTEVYSPTISNSASNTPILTVTNFTSAINPTTGWNYQPAAVTSGASSYTGFASGTARTGTVFDLGAAVPEPSSIALLGLIGLAGLRRKR